MKTFARIALFSFLLLFVLIAGKTFAQETIIPIKPYTMQVPDVSKLSVKGLDYRYEYTTPNYTQVTPDSIVTDSTSGAKTAYFDGQVVTQKEFWYVYYKLLKADGRTAWDGNWNVPVGIYNNITHYKKGTVTGSTLATLNGFFTAGGLPEIVAVMPEPE